MSNAAITELAALLERRRSPYEFDPTRPVADTDVRALFDAARSIMSSYNAQPWRYIVANRAQDAELWQRVLEVLVPGNQAWARFAPVLALGLYVPEFEYNGKPNKAAQHDLGAASAVLTLAATARDLAVHQMIGIDVDAARDAFGLEGRAEPFTALAIGYAGLNAELSDDLRARDEAEKPRKALDELILEGSL
ncbi:MAG: nitroreductase family protein [Pseudomonadota bacterium]